MNKNKLIAGVDEVGRGSWIGPVFSAAVILKKSINKNLLKDSKKIKLCCKLKKPMNLTIIILAHNEEKTIKKHVEDIKRKIINKIKKTELIIFHDGSRDSTHEILLKLKRKHKFIKGRIRYTRMCISCNFRCR